jgi:uncharacterized membrane protein YwaF
LEDNTEQTNQVVAPSPVLVGLEHPRHWKLGVSSLVLSLTSIALFVVTLVTMLIVAIAYESMSDQAGMFFAVVWVCLSIPLALVALVLGILARKIKPGKIGLWCSLISLISYFALLIYIIKNFD